MFCVSPGRNYMSFCIFIIRFMKLLTAKSKLINHYLTDKSNSFFLNIKSGHKGIQSTSLYIFRSKCRTYFPGGNLTRAYAIVCLSEYYCFSNNLI